jgi:DNA replication protein DnaC
VAAAAVQTFLGEEPARKLCGVLRLPAISRQYQELGRQAAQGNLSYEAFLLALVEIEAQQREENAHQKRLRMARFPVIKSLDQFDFAALPSLNKAKVRDRSSCSNR